jgi:membrane protein
VRATKHGNAGNMGPAGISGIGWWRVIGRVGRAVFSDDLLGVSGGVAFYAWFAAVFVLVFGVSLYGLIRNPEAIRGQIEALSGLLPEEATHFLADQMQMVAAASAVRLGAGLGGAFLVALWSARASMATLIAALNIAYREREARPFLRLQAVTLVLTGAAILFGALAFALLALLPAVVNQWAVDHSLKAALALGRWPILALLITITLAALYRFAPCRRTPRWRWVSRGAAVATVLWLLGSAGFSYYVANLSAAYSTFGVLGTVLVLQTWLYITAFAVLLGAKLNAEAEQQSGRRADE